MRRAASGVASLLLPPRPLLRSSMRGIATNGRVTNEDRRWWLIHLECAPDITPGTFVAWLDCCGTHTTKKLIERNIWTIEQVAQLDSDKVDELKYREGCLKMDIVWEHARTIITPLRQREKGGGVESELQSRILELRRRRELERQREALLKEQANVSAQREATLQKLRDAIAAKKAALLQKLSEGEAHKATAGAGGGGDNSHDAQTGNKADAPSRSSVETAIDRLGGGDDAAP